MRHMLALLALVLLPTAVGAQAPSPPTFEGLMTRATEANQAKNYEAAAAFNRQALAAAPDPDARAQVGYQIACIEGLRKRSKESLQALADAVRDGFSDWQKAASDQELKPIRGTAAFQRLIGEMKALAVRQRVFEVTRWENPDLGWAFLHSFDTPDSPKMKELRERYRLAEVIAGKNSELEKQLALLAWVHGRWRHDGWNEPSSSDALTILKEAEAGKHFRCVEYSITLAQVLQAMGFPARKIGLRRDGASYGIGKGHVVTEVWNNELGKWILLDGQNNATWRDGGIVLDAAEVRERYLGGKSDRLRMVHHGSPWVQAWKPAYQREWIVYFHHLSYRRDNDLFDRRGDSRDVELIRPGESHELLFQGSPQEDHAQTRDPARIYPALNLVHLDVGTSRTRGKIANLVTVELSNSSPGFDHYQIGANGELKEQRSSDVPWTLAPGPNTLVVRAVNRAGVAGPPSRIDITYHAPAPTDQPVR
jgi:hypothetical protein